MTERKRLLLINTCGERGFVALAEGAGVSRTESLPGRGTSEAMLPALRRLLPDGLGELDAIGVVNGPGSFTAVRVGLSTAKGLCEAAGCGMIAVSRLALIADAAGDGPVLALADAGRGEFFAGTYVEGRCVSEELLTLAELEPRLHEGAAVTCEARITERLGNRVRLIAEPDEECMCAMVQRRMVAGAWSDVAATDANYLRRTDAERLKDQA